MKNILRKWPLFVFCLLFAGLAGCTTLGLSVQPFQDPAPKASEQPASSLAGFYASAAIANEQELADLREAATDLPDSDVTLFMTSLVDSYRYRFQQRQHQAAESSLSALQDSKIPDVASLSRVRVSELQRAGRAEAQLSTLQRRIESLVQIEKSLRGPN